MQTTESTNGYDPLQYYTKPFVPKPLAHHGEVRTVSTVPEYGTAMAETEKHPPNGGLIWKRAWWPPRRSRNDYCMKMNGAHRTFTQYCWATHPIANKHMIGTARVSAHRLTEWCGERNYYGLLKADWHYNGTDKPSRNMGDQDGWKSHLGCIYAASNSRFWKLLAGSN